MPRSDDLDLRFSRRWSLTHRILAVNIFALAILAGSLFYLDSFRARLTTARLEQAASETRMIAEAVRVAAPGERAALLRRVGADSGTRLRIYRADGVKRADSWAGVDPTYEFRDPEGEPWTKDVARALDNAFDAIVGARQPPYYVPPRVDTLAAWPEAQRAIAGGPAVVTVRRAPDGTPFISAASAIGVEGRSVLLLTTNARDIRRIVRAERLSLGFVLTGTILLSILLSLFLARTIARPLKRLALAAHRVRLGRAREVAVPTLPARRDEIGLLARALHDMTQSLRQRIDATEAFAADVTHELKNPLASLRSAVDSLDKVQDPALIRQLTEVIRNDVQRLDRLIVDIAETSRLDAELSRARFESVDLGKMMEALLPLWETRAAERGVRLAFARPRVGTAVIPGAESRLGRAIDNLVDNAISFSPPGGVVEIAAARVGNEVLVTVEDAGPGVPAEAREAIFQRFHSVRPEGETFGSHSGLGLAIARAIIEGHDGRVIVEDRGDGRKGARFVIRFPGDVA
ncbi:sensor histidine kinase [Allosphingosinicella indica]|uniref:histidine kinase n=1 Tax=Allosphingosinicella indica TaxID=941907 RepID=A0A1X7H3N6_9SPHN|nr:ATP-binding protein [Allosphingosinicella indica]SMF79068.1 two-component system, OmpR family, sensor histidine kinase ChvG [Allosphingosinicella indica]